MTHTETLAAFRVFDLLTEHLAANPADTLIIDAAMIIRDMLPLTHTLSARVAQHFIPETIGHK